MSRLFLLVCGSYQREVSAALAQDGYGDVIVSTFPSFCGTPTLRSEDLSRSLPDDFGPGDEVHVLGGGCLLGRLDMKTVPGHWHVHRMGVCHEMLAGHTLCREEATEGAYLLSSGWLGNWRNRLAGWGFDQDTARKFFSESARSLLLLDTGVLPGSAEELAAFAAFVDLPAESLSVGLDHLRLCLDRIVLQWRLETERTRQEGSLNKARRELAEYAMSLDLLAGFNQVLTEEETVRKFLDVCTALFAPSEMAFLPMYEGTPGTLAERRAGPRGTTGLQEKLLKITGEYAWTEATDGFMVRVTFEGNPVGVLFLRDFAFPENAKHYLSLALVLARVFGLALSGARAHQELRLANEELEQRVRRRTAQLGAANRDLEDFCYMISHELRAPLARLEGFSGMIRESVQSQEWDQIDGLAGRLEVSSRRTKTIIDGLLSLTRLALDDLHRSGVDLSLMSREILDGLARDGRRIPPRVTIAEDLVVSADPRMLALAMGHLIDNAVKFMAKNPDAHLHIGAVTGARPLTVFLKDNGAGFDMTQAGNLFTPFSRLHAELDFEGYGLGLAMVRKIVERHGGTIRAESSPGAGATFFFTLGEA